MAFKNKKLCVCVCVSGLALDFCKRKQNLRAFFVHPIQGFQEVEDKSKDKWKLPGEQRPGWGGTHVPRAPWWFHDVGTVGGGGFISSPQSGLKAPSGVCAAQSWRASCKLVITPLLPAFLGHSCLAF